MALEPVLVPGTANPSLAGRLAQETGWDVAATDIRRFPDREVYVRITDDVSGRVAVIVQSTHPNDNLVELLLLQDAAKEAGAARLVAVTPYYGYARQDRVFHAGEAISSRAVARALSTTADSVVTVDPHKEEILDFFFGGAHAFTAIPAIADQLRAWETDCVLAPDRGARARAEEAARLLGVPVDHLEKTRLSPTEVVMRAKDLDVRGRRVAIVDDLIASGGTMMTAARQLKQQGATHVYAACTHGLFTDGAVAKMKEAGIDRVLCTDTLEQPTCETVSAAPAIAAGLRRLLAKGLAAANP